MKTLLISLLMLISQQGFAQLPKGSIPASELSIANISLEQSEKVTIQKLGKPLRRENNGEGFVLSYLGLTVTHAVAPYGVYEMMSTSPKHCTPRGVCPGMSISGLKKLYGEPQVVEREGGQFLEYYGIDTTCWLQISAPQSVIKYIRVACQP